MTDFMSRGECENHGLLFGRVSSLEAEVRGMKERLDRQFGEILTTLRAQDDKYAADKRMELESQREANRLFWTRLSFLVGVSGVVSGVLVKVL